MQTKLTLRLDEALIQRAKTYAEERGSSLSRLVADYFSLLTQEQTDTASKMATDEMPPITASLWGLLGDAQVDEADYHRHLEEKYR